MTPAIVVAAVVTLGLAFGSLIMQVDGAKLRRWRLSRRWDVSRLAREFIAAADEPLATVRGLTHMINAWERGDRRPSERYWLLYLRVFPECATVETAIGGANEPEDQPRTAEFNATATAAPSPAHSVQPQDISALVATVRALEQRIAGLSKRVDELSRDEGDKGDEREKVGERDKRQRREASVRRKTRSRYRPSSWTPLYLCTALVLS
jgi:hypothetical protein